MADVSVTAASVTLVNGPFADGLSGEAITAGMAVYLSAAGTWLKAQRDGTQVEAGQYGLGVALNSAPGTGQPIRVALPGALIVAGGTVAAGVVYYVSATAGGFTIDAPASTNWNSVLALGVSTSRLRVIGLAAEAVLA